MISLLTAATPLSSPKLLPVSLISYNEDHRGISAGHWEISINERKGVGGDFLVSEESERRNEIKDQKEG